MKKILPLFCLLAAVFSSLAQKKAKAVAEPMSFSKLDEQLFSKVSYRLVGPWREIGRAHV